MHARLESECEFEFALERRFELGTSRLGRNAEVQMGFGVQFKLQMEVEVENVTGTG